MLVRATCCALMLGLATLIAAGCQPRQPAKGTTKPVLGVEEPKYTIGVVPKGTAHVFWESVRAGAEAAGDELGAKIIWNGPAVETDIAGQKRILEDLVTREVDAFVVAACDADALTATLRDAKEKGIPVVTIDSGISDEELPVTYVATDNVAGAELAGEKLAELIGDEGEVGLMPFIKGAVSSDERQQGFEQEIARHPNISIAITLWSQSDPAKGRDAAEAMLTAHPDLDGIFAANEPGGVACARLLDERGLAGKVKLVAFDASEPEIEALRKGTIQALIVQNPFKMGYEGVSAAIKHLQGEAVEPRIDTGVTVVTQENVDDPTVQEILHPPGVD